MAENYKHLYEQCKKMLAMYQDELIPGFRKKIEELEQNQVEVRCKDCKYWGGVTYGYVCSKWSAPLAGFKACTKPEGFCADGERRTDHENP